MTSLSTDPQVRARTGAEPRLAFGRQARVTARYRLLALSAAVVVLASACAAGSSSPGPSLTIPGPSQSPGATLDGGDVRILLIDRFGPPWYCDPDQFPLARPSFDEQATAVARFAEMQAEGTVFNAIVRHLGLAGSESFTAPQKLEIYRLWKQAVAVQVVATAGGYQFDYSAAPVGGATAGVRTTGQVDTTGRITVTSTGTAEPPNCPICLARGTPIDTPAGPVPVELLSIGQRIWTLDATGNRIEAEVVALGSTIAPPTHRVIRLVLADGRTVTASPGHPLADGRTLGSLRVGDEVAGSPVISLDWLDYGSGRTYDLVVSGPTGIYLSDGIPLRSTLR